MEEKQNWKLEQCYQKLESKKTLLLKLDEQIPWSEFRPLLEQIHDKPRKSNAGRKPIDVILMFKMLVLQQLYNISDEDLEYQVNDRLSFMGFLDLTLADSVSDATTVPKSELRSSTFLAVGSIAELPLQYINDP